MFMNMVKNEGPFCDIFRACYRMADKCRFSGNNTQSEMQEKFWNRTF